MTPASDQDDWLMADLPGLCLTPTPSRKRPPRQSITNLQSHKHRRISIARSLDVSQISEPVSIPTGNPESSDRFIPSRPDFTLPLTVTPRTRRLATAFGCKTGRVLNFVPESSILGDKLTAELQNAIDSPFVLYKSSRTCSPTSCLENLAKRQKNIIALDGPGISKDPMAYPMTWSRNNYIAVGCGPDIFYQNLTTRAVSHLTKINKGKYGKSSSLEWGGQKDMLAIGTTDGYVQVWDVSGRTCTRSWLSNPLLHGPGESIGGMDWSHHSLAVGRTCGRLTIFDEREKHAVERILVHKGKVHGVKWSPDGSYLATGDEMGTVYVWDRRAGKLLGDGQVGAKLAHNGPVKALAWCTWRSDLLATGSMYPEGTIRVYSTKHLSSTTAPAVEHTLSLNSSVTSLQWSPHCKELLSTHGTAWTRPNPEARRGSKPTIVRTPLTNSITVHAFPSYEKILSVSNAHAAPIGQSCLSPDGTKVFTLCPDEEVMKLWHVWGMRKQEEKENMLSLGVSGRTIR